jgi:predicted AAA+ superfamily ATPase
VAADPAVFPLVERHLKPLVEEMLNDFRVVVINGPRQAGKTTLLRELHAAHGGTFRSLDREGLLRAARDDPLGFITDLPRPVFIDEVQRGGDALVRAIKIVVDEETSPERSCCRGPAGSSPSRRCPSRSLAEHW